MGAKFFVAVSIFTSIVFGLGSPVFAKSAPQSIAVLDSLLAGATPLDSHVVYVDFWASWCVPCRQSFPWMKQLNDKYASRGLQVVAVSVDKSAIPANKFLKEMDVPFKVIYDSTGTLAKLYNLEAMPTSFVYGRDGKLRTDHRGFLSERHRVS